MTTENRDEMETSTSLVVTDEAVEAAAKTMIDSSQYDGGWEALPQFITEKYRNIARTALEAAVPYLRDGKITKEAVEKERKP
jgi:hypothetical protein